mgnify:FL=1
MPSLEYTISFPKNVNGERIEWSNQTFSIAFCESNTPKDMWDHLDAVEDYLIDAVLGAFQSIPKFEIRKIRKKTEDGWRSIPRLKHFGE